MTLKERNQANIYRLRPTDRRLITGLDKSESSDTATTHAAASLLHF
jgi:hypothetical protein